MQVLPDIVGSAVCQKFFIAAFLQAEFKRSWTHFYNKELDCFHILCPWVDHGLKSGIQCSLGLFLIALASRLTNVGFGS